MGSEMCIRDSYITAEFPKKDAEATFPVGDGKIYSRIGVKDPKRKRRNVNERKLAYENSYGHSWLSHTVVLLQ